MQFATIASFIFLSSLVTSNAEVTKSIDSLIKEANSSTSGIDSSKVVSLKSAHTTIEQKVHEQINAHRVALKLKPLAADPRIIEQARKHSQNMAAGVVEFSHSGFNERVKVISKELQVKSSAENVAYSRGYSDPASQAVQGWLKSSGHKKNIEGDFTYTGIGVAQSQDGKIYTTQIFVK